MTRDKLKIGVSCYPTYGGSGIVATELGKCLAERGHEVHFITYAMPMRLASFKEKVFFHEVDTPEYPLFEYAPYSLALASVMSEVAEEHKLDVIHAHYAIPHAASAYLAKQILKGKLKVITTLHGTDISLVGNQPAYLPVVKFTIEQSDAVTAVSKWLAEETRKTLGIEHKISVIPNFMDTGLFARKQDIRLRRKLAMDSQPIIMHISNFRPVKRTEDLIRVLNIVREKIDAVLVLVGDGPARVKVERICRQMNMCGNTIFLGKQLDIIELLSQADVYLSTSESESFGLSALEAMSCGAPVVATNVGGVPEVITDGEDGFLNNVGDVEGMAGNIIRLLNDTELHRTIAISGRHKVEKEFCAEKIVKMYEDLYFKMVES